MLRRRQETNDAPVQGLKVRQVPARILTPAGWIVGKLHVANEWRMINYINNAPDFFTLEDVVVEGRPRVLPLFTLQRSAIEFIVVETEEDRKSDMPQRERIVHPIWCLLQNGLLHGKIEIIPGVRLSEFLSRSKNFLLLNEVHFILNSPRDERTIDHKEPVVLLNPAAVIGVTEFLEERK